MTLFRLNDTQPSGMMPVASVQEAQAWNQKGFGIFHTVNRFKNNVRRNTELAELRFWYVDMDKGCKESQRETILRAPLCPSVVVETKRGHHVYWKIKRASQSLYGPLMANCLIPYFRGDKNAKDIARVLRTPGFLHQKDPNDPFLVKCIWKKDIGYDEKQIVACFPLPEEVKAAKVAFTKSISVAEARSYGSDDFWLKVYRLDHKDALARLSGSHWVSGEQYEFRQNHNGNENIIVDGKGTSCWIDQFNRIGSHSKGGPTIAQWLRWMGHDWRDVARCIKELYPGIEREG